MQNIANIKSIQGVQYYTGAHPAIRSLVKQGSRPTEFGHKVWATTFILINYLSNHEFNLNKKSVLEVGCGWGILGLFLAKKFDSKVTCTDLDEKVLPIVKAHSELNLLSVKAEPASFGSISDESLKSAQVIVGAEVCYSAEACKDLLSLIKRAYTHGIEQVLISDPGRPDFLSILCEAKTGFKKNIYSLPGSKNGKETHLLHLHR